MATKDTMTQLGSRLEPVREEFKSREYRWSLDLIESQIPDDDSLFWRLPFHLLKNLQRVLGPDRNDRTAFFYVIHGYRYRQQLERAGIPVPDISGEETILKQCMGPSEADVRERGLIPFPGTLCTVSPQLNTRLFLRSLNKHLELVFNTKPEWFAPGEWVYQHSYGPWFVRTWVFVGRGASQIQLEHDIALGRLGRGRDLDLRAQMSLHGVLAMANIWNLVQAGKEEQMAQLAAEYCGFFRAALPTLLDGLDPGISPKEVSGAEEEWLQWYETVRRSRIPVSLRSRQRKS